MEATIIKHSEPFLKWAGNKRFLDISNYVDTYNQYHEPFLGSGSVYFKSVSPNPAFLSDLNQPLIQTFLAVRDHCDELLELLQTYQAQHCSDFYYQIRSQPESDDVVKAGARFIYLNRTCFNGLYRENSKGQFNVPMGQYENPAIYNPERLKTCSEALQGAVITCQSYQNAVVNAQPGDLIYFDPPYYQTFTKYHKSDFKESDQVKLKNLAVDLIHKSVKVLISNSDCEFIRELYDTPEFTIHTVTASRRISCKAEGRGKVPELLIQSSST